MPAHLRKEQCCTHRDDDCMRPIYQAGLCSAHFRLWKQVGGPYPGEVRRYILAQNGDEFEVIDLRAEKVVFKSTVANEALDKWTEYRLEERLDAA